MNLDRTKAVDAVADEVRRALEAQRLLRAALWAARHVVLTKERFWTSAQEERMKAALEEQVRERLYANDDAAAVMPAAYHRMLTPFRPWTLEEHARVGLAAERHLQEIANWRQVTSAQTAIEYVLITGLAPWSAERADMLAALSDDLLLRFRRTDYLGAAERLVAYRILSEGVAG